MASASKIDTRPKVVDIDHYAGDSLVIRVRAPAELVAGLRWDAAVKSAPGQPIADAVFRVTEPETGEDGKIQAYLILPTEDTTRLALSGKRRRTTSGGWAFTYLGFWDCQVSDDLNDPVTTLARGALNLTIDVTRPDA